MSCSWLLVAFFFSLASFSEEKSANLVLLTDAPKQNGAMCLDGSPPGYYFRAGSGDGVSKWIIHLEGGGWCYDEEECVGRSKTPLGTSKMWGPTKDFTSGLLSDDQEANPDFYTWNVAFAAYCDGASFAGNVDQPVKYKEFTLNFKGFPVLTAILNSLMEKGLSNATEVILTGCSAGGLATYLHADYVASVLPKTAKYHAIADAGYFLDAANIKGDMDIRGKYQYVFKMQNCGQGVNQDCIKATPKNEAWKCFMAQYTEPYISSPLFGLNSIYDSWQLANILQIPCQPPNCTTQYMNDFENYRQVFLNAAAGFISREGRGYFFDSCITHCQSLNAAWNKIMVKGQSAAVTFGDWYFKRTGAAQEVDCAYPCNKSC